MYINIFQVPYIKKPVKMFIKRSRESGPADMHDNRYVILMTRPALSRESLFRNQPFKN